MCCRHQVAGKNAGRWDPHTWLVVMKMVEMLWNTVGRVPLKFKQVYLET